MGKKTPVAVRFSTVGGESGSADTARDPRGFAVKFYTEEGNWDLVGNNTPIFFIRDPILFPSFIHTQKRNPVTHLKVCYCFYLPTIFHLYQEKLVNLVYWLWIIGPWHVLGFHISSTRNHSSSLFFVFRSWDPRWLPLHEWLRIPYL